MSKHWSMRPSPPGVPAHPRSPQQMAATGAGQSGQPWVAARRWAVVSPAGRAATAASSVSSLQNYVISEVCANAAWKMDGTKSL